MTLDTDDYIFNKDNSSFFEKIDQNLKQIEPAEKINYLKKLNTTHNRFTIK